MDLSSSKPLREVQFTEKIRGYSPDEVDAFLDEVAAGLDALLARLGSGEAVPRGAAPGSGGGGPVAADATAGRNETELIAGETVVGRALIAAQRAADQLLAEAEESAQAVRELAERDAERVRKAAQADADATTSDLEGRRHKLQEELAKLEVWAVHRRDTLRELLAESLARMDDWLEPSRTPSGGPSEGFRPTA